MPDVSPSHLHPSRILSYAGNRCVECIVLKTVRPLSQEMPARTVTLLRINEALNCKQEFSKQMFYLLLKTLKQHVKTDQQAFIKYTNILFC